MQLLQNDIIIRKYKDEERLWVSQRLVMSVCEVDGEYLRKRSRNSYKKSLPGYKRGAFLPDSGKAWRWGRANGTFYYDFDRIPDRKPTYYRSKLGTKQELLKAYEELQLKDERDRRRYLTKEIKNQVSALVDNTDQRYYIWQNEFAFSPQKANELALSRAWFNWMTQQLADDNFKKLGIYQKQDFYQTCTELISPLNLEGCKVNSADYLRNKLAAFPATASVSAQREFFISGKYGNENAKIVGKYQLFNEDTGEIFDFDIHQLLIYTLYMNPGGSTKEYIHSLWQKYIPRIEEFGQEPVSYRAFCHHVSRFNKNILMAKARHGKDYYRKEVLTYVPAKRLQYAHSLFAADGSGTINYKYTKSNGKISHRKLYCIFVSDIASRKIVGWAPAKKGMSDETPEMTQSAVKMAVEKGGFQTMFEFVSDNHGSFTSAESKSFLNLVFDKVRTIEPGNSQANPAETMFRLFKQDLKDIENLINTSYGVGIEGLANPDHLDIDELPTYEDAIIQLHELIERWNSTAMRDGVTPNEKFENNKHPKCEDMDPRAVRYLFGNHTEVDISYMRGFVKVRKGSVYHNTDTEYLFEIPGFGGYGTEMIAKKVGYTSSAKLKVVFTEEMADLYTPEGEFILSCPPAQRASQSHAESGDDELAALEENMRRKDAQMTAADEFSQSLEELLHEVDQDTPLDYRSEMALGGNKESYNSSMEQGLDSNQNNNKKSAQKRIDRDWKDSDWADFNNDNS